ncbi:MAG: DUF2267 domain-containing protein [Chloroflexota bacterium]
MDELVKLVTEKTGISEAQAQQAVEMVLKFVKDKLPPELGDTLDSLLDLGDEGGSLDIGDVAKTLGGLFGNK